MPLLTEKRNPIHHPPAWKFNRGLSLSLKKLSLLAW